MEQNQGDALKSRRNSQPEDTTMENERRSLQSVSSKSKIKVINRTLYNTKVPSTGNLMIKKNPATNKFDVTTQELIGTADLTNTDR